MDTIKSVYKKAGIIISRRPWKFWGVVLLSNLIITMGYVLAGGVPILGIVLEVLVEAALAKIFVRGLFNESPVVEDIFAAFKNWDTAIHVLGGMLWRDLWIFLWALIPFVGPVFAVIRAYEYRFVPYILMDEPEIGAKEALNVSKSRTNGKKAKMFWADFIAVAVVIVLQAVIFGLSTVRFLSWLFIPLFILAVLVGVLVYPFFAGLVSAIFYVDGERARKESKYYVEPEVQEEKKAQPAEPQTDYYSADKFCPRCGAPMKSGDVFCAACGERYDAPAPSDEDETIVGEPMESLVGEVPVAETLNPEDIE